MINVILGHNINVNIGRFRLIIRVQQVQLLLGLRRLDCISYKQLRGGPIKMEWGHQITNVHILEEKNL